MNLNDLRRTVTAFADAPIDVDMTKGRLVAQIREEIVEVRVTESEGQLWVQENSNNPITAYKWVTERVARLSLLAEHVIARLPREKHFVTPEGELLEDIESSPDNSAHHVTDATLSIKDNLDLSLAGVSRILYLTSDAGEGKTTVINETAIRQAEQFKNKEATWLLVPISLSGRPFMALDDVVVAELTNRFRFMLYFDAFLELVRLNAIVPALDGFEEVFVETGTGEAVSALANLINQLNGSGRALIAARKAYFEIRSFASQSRIFDSIASDSGVSFQRLSLSRWSKSKFIEYAEKRSLQDAEEIYEMVSSRLQPEHPMLTRAVLVERLIDLSLDGDVKSLLDRLGDHPEDYFYEFVNTIIEREATQKWIDRSQRGDAAKPLLTANEHHILLAYIAREMWVNQSDSLRTDYLELVAELFSSELSKPATIARQINERLHQHSLLATTEDVSNKIGFDHEDFRLFFLGQALGQELIKDSRNSLASFLRVASLPSRTADAAIAYVARNKANAENIVLTLLQIGADSLDTSFEKENASILLIRLISAGYAPGVHLKNLVLPSGAMDARYISDVTFQDCIFQPVNLRGCRMDRVRFVGCSFDRIEIGSTFIAEDAIFESCEISSVYLVDSDYTIFSPPEINKTLREFDVHVVDNEQYDLLEESEATIDEETRIAEQALRAFMRATHLNEGVFRQRLGQDVGVFFEDIMPRLIDAGVLEEIEYRGAGHQRRFKLSTPMKNIEPAIRCSRDFSTFLSILKSGETE